MSRETVRSLNDSHLDGLRLTAIPTVVAQTERHPKRQ